MKASEIRTDGTEYAYQRNVHSYGRRVKVLQKATVPSYGYNMAQSGWLVEFLDQPVSSDRRGTPKGLTKAVTSRQITALWEVFDAQAKADREQRAAEKAAYDAELAKQEQAVKALGALFEQYGIAEGIRPTSRMRFTAFDLNSLLEDLMTAVTNEYVGDSTTEKF